MGLLFERAASARHPLSRATAALRGPASGRGRDGAAFLAELLDFKGAVELSRALGTRPEVTPVATAAALDDALAAARQLLGRAEREARRPLDERADDGSLLSAARIDAMLQKVFARPMRRNAVANAARELLTPLEGRVRDRLLQVRRIVREARDEVGPVVAARGPVGARLEQLDAALGAATSVRVDALFARALAGLGDVFAADIERATVGLPRSPRGEWLPPWADAPRFAAEHVARCEALIVATFQHERSRLDMLVTAVLGEDAR